VAGAAAMNASQFVFYNITGAVIWVTVCAGAGYLFGNVPIIKDNFSLVAIGIVLVSVLPIVVEYFRHRRPARS
jgi:membrane-associated protein